MSAAKFWPRESRNLIGPLTIELSMEVNCLRVSLTISIRPPSRAKEQPRNKSAEVKCVALINSRRSTRIVTISLSTENGVRFDASCLSPGAEKYSNSEVLVKYVFRFIASCLGIFI